MPEGDTVYLSAAKLHAVPEIKRRPRYPEPVIEKTGQILCVRDVIGATDWSEGSTSTMEWLASLLRDEGVDLMQASEDELTRGTPVFVEAAAGVDEVQRRMAKKHIRRLPVVEDGRLVGIVDLVDLAMHSDQNA
ncbi:MAG: CBS domain-containing protein [Actinobacteria bacterium]|nr:CBS domain-containing protein [Actinomycetota bacterium]